MLRHQEVNGHNDDTDTTAHLLFYAVNSLDTLRLHRPWPLSNISYNSLTLQNHKPSGWYFVYLILVTIPKKTMSAPALISTFHVADDRGKATLRTLHTQVCLTLES